MTAEMVKWHELDLVCKPWSTHIYYRYYDEGEIERAPIVSQKPLSALLSGWPVPIKLANLYREGIQIRFE